ncbi:TPA: VENN motif pre-toxin domain-containing protein [Raoultella planticola]
MTLATLAAGLAGGSSTSGFGAQAGKTTVENNYLSEKYRAATADVATAAI